MYVLQNKGRSQPDGNNLAIAGQWKLKGEPFDFVP